VGDWFRLVGPSRTLEIFGVKLVGVNAENCSKLLFTLGFVVFMVLLHRALSTVAGWVLRRRENSRVRFWTYQGIRLACTALLILGLVSIWFDDPTRLATALGLVSAGLAFALQKAVTALVGYFIILRGRTFNVGDRITMGGVRGDVIALGFFQTTIMEMGKPPHGLDESPSAWVHSRQYTGRIVTVTNDKIFSEPVYNYTREFPYIWEEMILPVPYTADRARAERILLEAAGRHTVHVRELGEAALEELERRYFMKRTDMTPRVYYRLTDNWLEMTVRFLTDVHGTRDVKDAMSRDVIRALDEAGIGIASGTYDIVGLPPLRIEGAALPRPVGADGHS
jgi:small-conductance mechanosensitive channel